MGRKKKDLKYLRKLIHRLTATEVKSLKQYLRCFDPNFDDEHRVKTLILLEILEKSPKSVTEAEIQQQVYPGSEKGNLKYLRLRLLNKIYESLLLEVNVERKGLYTEHARANIEVRKKLIQAQILWGRNITDELMVLLQQIIRKSTKYELYPELLEALYLKQQFLGFRDGLKTYMKVQQEIDQNEAILRSLRKAKHYYTQIILEGASSASKPPPSDFIEQAQTELKQDFETYQSPSIGYFYYMISLELSQQQQDFESGAVICADLVTLLKTHPAVFTKRRMGIAYGQYANNELFHRKFESAIEYARSSRNYFKPGSMNHGTAVEMEFYGHYYQDQFKLAAKTLSPLLLQAEISQTESQYQRRCFLYASVLFQLGQFKQAETWLQHTSGMLSDKKGWNLGIRLLNILLHIELERFDGIDLAVDALRKHITNLKKRDHLPERYTHILKILNRIRTCNYNFQKAQQESQSDLKSLECNTSDCKWEVKGPEMIKFHEWFRKKALKRSRFTRV